MALADEFDVIVLGCGAMGAAACHHVARRGARVLGIERFQLGHGNGSSHGHSRVIRQAYFEHPDYVPLLRRTYALFEALERESGERLFLRCGALFGGRADSEVVSGSRVASERHGVPHEILDADGVRRRFPQFRLPDDYVALFEPDAGCVRPEATTLAHARLARAAGGTILEETRVLAWHEDHRGVQVATDRGTFRAAQLIVTAGAWTPSILANLGISLRVTRQPLLWLDQRDSATRHRHALAELPVWLIDRHDGTSIYGIPFDPVLTGPKGMKVAIHGGGIEVDPETVDRDATESEIGAARDATRAVLPESAGHVLASAICLYTYSPDSNFIVDRMPGYRRVTIACGFSGHGFKFAPVLGEALADLAIDGGTDAAIEFLGVERFRTSAARGGDRLTN